MIGWLDRFVDTKEKRYHVFFLITLLFALLIVIPYIIMACYLFSLGSYESLYALLKEPIVQATWLSRVLLDVISFSSISFIQIFYTLCINTQWYEVIMLLLIVLAYPILESKKTMTWLMLLILLTFIISMVCIGYGLQAESLNAALFYIRSIGVTLFISNIMILGMLLVYLKRQILAYRVALAVDCIEIKDI